jgi:hypothetical protein
MDISGSAHEDARVHPGFDRRAELNRRGSNSNHHEAGFVPGSRAC